MSKNEFFVLEYPGGCDTCPPYIPGEYNHSELEWDNFAIDPEKLVINKEYSYSITTSTIERINFDYYGAPDYFVSDRFLTVCTALNVKYRAIPLKIVIHGEAVAEQRYFMFLPGEYRYILDTKESEFSVEIDVDSGKPKHNQAFPQGMVYAWIKHFIPTSDPAPHLFWCAEIMQIVCTREFKSKAEEAKLSCLSFVPMGQSYHYDPWGDLTETV
jgi:hypothetical protein